MGQPIRVLLIEDNPDDACLLSKMLGQARGISFSLLHAEQLKTGLARLAADDIDVVLLDLSLPDGHGLQTVVRTCAAAPDVPIIVFTGLEDELMAVQAIRAGAEDYLLKSHVNIDSLEHSIRYAIERQRAERALAQSQERERAVIAAALESVLIVDHEGKIVEFNPAAAKTFGYTRAEAIAKSLTDLIVFHSMDEILPVAGEKPELGKRVELIGIRADGTQFPAELALTLLPSEGPPTFAGFLRDITDRKRSEEALRVSDLRFHTVTRATNDAVWDWDLMTNAVWWNEGVNTLFGYATGDVGADATWWYDHIHPEERDRVVSGIHALINNGEQSWRDEYRYRRADGSYAYVFDRGYVLRDDRGTPVRMIGAMVDLTERRRAEEESRLLQTIALAISEAADFPSALEGVLSNVCETTGWILGQAWVPRADGTVLECSRAWHWAADGLDRFRALSQQIVFPPGRGLPGRVWSSKRPVWIRDVTVDGNFPRAPLAREVGLKAAMGIPVLAGEDVVAVIEFFVREPREEDGRLVQFVSTIATQLGELMQRKRAEEALRASEERYRELFQNANDMVYTHDLHGNFTSINKAGERITGYTRAEFTRMNIAQIIAPDQVDIARQQIDRKVGGETERTTYEVEIIAKDGRRIPVEVSTRLIYRDGKPVEIQGISRDVTERRQLEEQLRQAQKMEAIGRLAGGVSHDFNNLLTAIMGYSDLVLVRLGAESPLRRDVEEIRGAAERAAALTRQLLTFSRRQIVAPKLLDLNAVVLNMHKMLDRLIGEDIDLVTLPASPLGAVKADPGQIEQVIMNLAVNARDAMPHGGKLTIETADVELDDSYTREHVGVRPGPYVMMGVSDTGCGMDAEVVAHIFEPFFTTKEPGKGTGLGLSTVYGIIKQSGGHINVYTHPGQGTTFKIYLPCIGYTTGTQQPSTSSGSLSCGNETLLLVEDEDSVRAMMRQVLESSGYKVLEARRGQEAVAICERHDDLIHLLVTDILMPQVNGPELARRLRQNRPDLKVLYVSGYTDRAVVRHGVLDSGSHFLQKPFTPQALTHKIRAVLEGARETGLTFPDALPNPGNGDQELATKSEDSSPLIPRF